MSFTNPLWRGPGVPEETTMRYKANGSAEMTDTSLVRACGVCRRLGASPLMSMVRISAIVDACFGVVADGVSARSWTITEARE
jgi:hypothetical protein